MSRVLLITRNFPPLRGGMERLNERMFHFLHENDPSSALVGPAGCSAFVPPSTCVSEAAGAPLPATLITGAALGLVMARRLRPSVVLAGSGLAAPAAIAAARMSGASSAVFLHGLDIIVANRIYQRCWLPCIRRCDRVLVNSGNTRRLAIEAGVRPERMRVVHPGTYLPRLDVNARSRFRKKNRISEAAPVLLSVGRITARKGLARFVDLSMPSILAVHPNAKLVIVGDQAQDGLNQNSGGGIGPVRKAARARGVEDAIIWLGPCSDAELADAYQGSDVHVFPVRDVAGDVEGFGMVAIEAAAHGLPTVAFDVGGVSDAVEEGVSGRLVPPESYDVFARVVCDLLAPSVVLSKARIVEFAQQFSWDRFGAQVIEALGLRS